MAKVLTEKAVEKLKPAAKRREIPDGGLSGLYLVIQPSGRKSWATRYRHNGKPCKLTIGSYPAVRLATAREKAGEALRAVSEGDDPAKSKRRQSTSPVDPNRDLVKSVVAEFLRKHFADKRSLGRSSACSAMTCCLTGAIAEFKISASATSSSSWTSSPTAASAA